MNTLTKKSNGETSQMTPWTRFFDVDSFFGRDFLSRLEHNFPAVNVSENDNSYVVEVVAPGFKKEDFNVSCDDDKLTISAESKHETAEEKKNYSRREYAYNSFTRSFYLPDNAKTDIAASYKDGILQLSIPKATPSKKTAKNITIS